MNPSVYIAFRYVLSKSKQSLVNLVSYLSFGVIVVSAMALTIVLSAFEGLKQLSVAYAYENSPEYLVVPTRSAHFKIDTEALLLWSTEQGVAVRAALQTLGLVERNSYSRAGQLIAYYPKGAALTTELLYGTDSLGSGELMFPLSSYYDLGGEEYESMVRVSVLQPGSRPIRLGFGSSDIAQTTLRSIGIYADPSTESNIAARLYYDDLLYLSQLSYGSFSALEIVETQLPLERLVEELTPMITGEFLIKSRADQNQSLFKLLNTEYVATYFIFTLIMALALFNLAGSIRLIMADKISSFPVLTQLGMLPNQIRSVFFILGVSVSFLGALLGIFLGVLVVLAQQWLGIIEIATAMAYPVELAFSNMILVLLTLIILGSGVSYLSSRSLPEPSKAIAP